MADSLTPPERPDNGARRTPTSVYRYYDAKNLLLYVGITSRGTARNSEHNADKDWWPFVVRQEVEHYASREDAARREVDLIRQYHPPFNSHHNSESAELRAAYLGFVASVSAPMEPRKPARSAIVLVPQFLAEKVSSWRTRREDADLARRLVASPEPTRVYRNGSQRGSIVNVDNHGLVAIVQVSHGHAIPDGFLYAHLRCAKKRPAHLEIKRATWMDATTVQQVLGEEAVA